jgi:hypothetical protein
MKIPACILIFLLAFLTVQPLFSTVEKPSKAMQCCSKAKAKCEKSKGPGEKEKGCENNRCNPFMSCTTGNFYVVESFYTNNSLFAIERIKPFLTDDNRLLTRLSECWHPPELI